METLTDPQIITSMYINPTNCSNITVCSSLGSPGKFARGNLNHDSFIEQHPCNKFCEWFGLAPLHELETKDFSAKTRGLDGNSGDDDDHIPHQNSRQLKSQHASKPSDTSAVDDKVVEVKAPTKTRKTNTAATAKQASGEQALVDNVVEVDVLEKTKKHSPATEHTPGTKVGADPVKRKRGRPSCQATTESSAPRMDTGHAAKTSTRKLCSSRFLGTMSMEILQI